MRFSIPLKHPTRSLLGFPNRDVQCWLILFLDGSGFAKRKYSVAALFLPAPLGYSATRVILLANWWGSPNRHRRAGVYPLGLAVGCYPS